MTAAISPSAAFGEIIAASDQVTERFLTEAYPALASRLLPILALLVVIYWGAYILRVYYGKAGFSVWDVVKNATWSALAFNVMNWGGWANGVYIALTNAIEGVAAGVLGGESDAQTTIAGLMDTFDPIVIALSEATWLTPGLVLHYVLLFLCILAVALIALLNLILAKFGLAVIFLLAPLFVCFAVFPITRGWFNAWLSKLVNFALVYILSVAVIRFGVSAMATLITNVEGYSDAAMRLDLDAFAAHLNTGVLAQLYLIPIVLTVFLFQVRGWAASLSQSAADSGIGAMAMLVIRQLPQRTVQGGKR